MRPWLPAKRRPDCSVPNTPIVPPVLVRTPQPVTFCRVRLFCTADRKSPAPPTIMVDRTDALIASLGWYAGLPSDAILWTEMMMRSRSSSCGCCHCFRGTESCALLTRRGLVISYEERAIRRICSGRTRALPSFYGYSILLCSSFRGQ